MLSRISEFNPPMTPAMATGLAASQIMRVSLSRARSSSSKVTKVSPLVARFTTISPPSRRSKSKAWRGWPYSNMT